MKLASHLKQSPYGVFYFRIVIPLSLRPLFGGQCEVKRSLNTKNPTTARRLAYMLWTHTAHRLGEAKRAMAGYDPKQFNPNDPSTWPSAADDARQWIAKIGAITIEADPNKPGDSEAAMRALNMLSRGRAPSFSDDDLENIGRIEDHYTPPPLSVAPVDTTIRFSQAKDIYLQLVEKEPQLKPKTLMEMRTVFESFLKWSHKPNDPQLSQIDRPMIERFMNHLLLEEPNKRTKTKGLSQATVKKQLSFLNGLFTNRKSDFPKGHDLPTTGVTPYRRGTQKRIQRTSRYLPFDSAELKTIFAPGNLGQAKKPHEFWCPLLGLYLGARLEEICQLRFSDIRREDDLTVVHIVAEAEKVQPGNKGGGKTQMTKADYLKAHQVLTGESLDDLAGVKSAQQSLSQKHTGTSLKNEHSERSLPLHADLVALGFLDYLDDARLLEPDGRIFPYLHNASNGYGDVPSEAFARYLDKLEITDSKKTFHSFRSTVNNRLQKKPVGLSEELCRLYLGQEVDSMQRQCAWGVASSRCRITATRLLPK